MEKRKSGQNVKTLYLAVLILLLHPASSFNFSSLNNEA